MTLPGWRSVALIVKKSLHLWRVPARRLICTQIPGSYELSGSVIMGGVIEFHSAPLCLYGAPVQTYKSGDYIRVLGRHLVPNIFHKEELRRLMISGRRAAAGVRVAGLPANYPLLLYSARAGGYHRWLGGIRPPIASVCRLGNIPVAGNLRSL